ncbi:MAG TPA: D-alanine--D-alanine ligase [Candidatus Saccharimonadia bacterium]|jgi:D-alanine-D-alanine ligase
MKVLVLGGGTSPERDVSLKSSAAVRAALEALNHDVVYVDPAEGDAAVLAAAQDADVVLPILHGPGGEDGEIQALLERTGKPYLGADVEASQRCMNKVVVKELLLENGLPTPEFSVVTRDLLDRSPLSERPFVLKPLDDGSSMDLVIVRELPYNKQRIEEVFGRHHEMLMEELVEGVEITVPILGNETLPIIEVVPPAGGEFDYENKYNGETTELCPPQHVSEEAQEQARRVALKVHHLTGVRHLSRTDMIVRPNNIPVVLEINTLPGMTNTSLYPKAAAAAGLSFEQLVDRLLKLALGQV